MKKKFFYLPKLHFELGACIERTKFKQVFWKCLSSGGIGMGKQDSLEGKNRDYCRRTSENFTKEIQIIRVCT